LESYGKNHQNTRIRLFFILINYLSDLRNLSAFYIHRERFEDIDIIFL